MKTTGKKVTRSTIKSFIKREMSRDNLYIKNNSSFDGMVDCVMPITDTGFRKATPSNLSEDYTLGVSGAWFVGSSRDYFTPFANDNFIGYEVDNCCGSFLIAMGRSNN
jgi:hypothetical protein